MGIKAAYMVPHPPLIVPAVGRGGEGQIKETTASYERVAEDIARIARENGESITDVANSVETGR